MRCWWKYRRLYLCQLFDNRTRENLQLTLEEVDGLVGDEVTRKILSSVDTAHNEGSVAIRASPQLNQVGLLLILLKFDGTTHHSNGVGRLVILVRTTKA